MAHRTTVLGIALAVIATGAGCQDETGFVQRQWTHVSETSAVIYWQHSRITYTARSYVEFGTTEELGQRTEVTEESRWAHFHRLTGLEKDTTYFYRMVTMDPHVGQRVTSPVLTFTTGGVEGAIRVPAEVDGPPFTLDRPEATYILTEDVTANGTGFVITAPNVTLDLDGHTVVFGNDTDEQVSGVLAQNEGKATICNGHIVQGQRCKEYSTAVESRWRAQPTEIFGISTDVHLRCAYPIKFLGRAAEVDIHHNNLYSRVTEIESRHYPGNDLIRLDIEGGSVSVHDNLLTEGCHVGIRLTGEGDNVEVHHNDIRHHQQYVNGYAIAAGCAGADIHHNRITSCGRGVHLTGERIRLHDNELGLYGHQQLDDIPAKSRPFKHQLVELHGIKFEGDKVRQCEVFGNGVYIIQKLPLDSDGTGLPEDKISSGVYVRSTATSLAPDRLIDATQSWEPDRWKGYFVKYNPDLPAAQITGNDATSLFADLNSDAPGQYTIFMKWQYVPATPLNVACYDPNAMNEVYGNTFVAFTKYEKTRHGGYGNSGQWASAIYFVGMDKGPAEEGKYSIRIRDNEFLSNDLFVSASGPVNMTVPITGNRFELPAAATPTEGHTPFRGIGETLEEAIKADGNVFRGMEP